jgi:hypothetical protein
LLGIVSKKIRLKFAEITSKNIPIAQRKMNGKYLKLKIIFFRFCEPNNILFFDTPGPLGARPYRF